MPAPAVTLEALEAKLGHTFRNPDLLVRSLTHKSRAFEDQAGEEACIRDNEQQEFLGDSILGFLISEALVRRCPNSPEGRLSKLKAYLVSAAHLHLVANRLELGSFLRLGRGEELSGGRSKRALLANALEAVIAALYLDTGIEETRRFVRDVVIGDFDPERGEIEELVTDHKSALQERALAAGLPAPRYTTVDEGGPEHSKTFTMEARIGSQWCARGEGPSKKRAGQKAAQRVLEQLRLGGE